VLNISQQHHPVATTNFAHYLFAEYQARAFLFCFLQLGYAFFLVGVPVVTLILKSHHTHIVQRKPTQDRGTVKAQCSRLVNGNVFNDLCLVAAGFTFQGFRSQS
jgi:hypothetical protein